MFYSCQHGIVFLVSFLTFFLALGTEPRALNVLGMYTALSYTAMENTANFCIRILCSTTFNLISPSFLPCMHSLCFFLLFWFVLFGGYEISLCSSDWPWTHYVVQAEVQIRVILLPQPPGCWDYKCVLPQCLAHTFTLVSQIELHSCPLLYFYFQTGST